MPCTNPIILETWSPQATAAPATSCLTVNLSSVEFQSLIESQSKSKSTRDKNRLVLVVWRQPRVCATWFVFLSSVLWRCDRLCRKYSSATMRRKCHANILYILSILPNDRHLWRPDGSQLVYFYQCSGLNNWNLLTLDGEQAILAYNFVLCVTRAFSFTLSLLCHYSRSSAARCELLWEQEALKWMGLVGDLRWRYAVNLELSGLRLRSRHGG